MVAMVQPKTRNQTFECMKLLASMFVVFIHFKFPGRLGELMTCLARFAVPLFFSISGYYSYRTKSSCLMRRILHLLMLNGFGILIYFAWNAFSMLYLGTDVPETTWLRTYHISLWLTMGVDPYWGYLWFLPSLALAYGILWGYTRLYEDHPSDFRPIYTAGFILMILLLTYAEFYPANNSAVHYFTYRNGFFFALPFLALGMFLRERQEQIVRAFGLTPKKLVWMILGTMAISVVEWHGIGACEIYLGTMLAVPALVLLAAIHPTITNRPVAARMLSVLGPVSAGVYLLHMAVIKAYIPFVRWRIVRIVGNLEPYCSPIVVALLSILASAFCVWCWALIRSVLKRK